MSRITRKGKKSLENILKLIYGRKKYFKFILKMKTKCDSKKISIFYFVFDEY